MYHSHRKQMDFPMSLEAWGTDDFTKTLELELSEGQWAFPFWIYTKEGGTVELGGAEFTIHRFKEESDSISVWCTVHFKEEVAMGCRDITDSQQRRGDFILTIDMETGQGTTERDSDSPARNLEYY